MARKRPTGRRRFTPRREPPIRGREDLILKAKVRDVFTPHHPIQSVDLFSGRQTEVQRLIEHINTPGQHALLFGERGVGKSSLANVVATLLQQKMEGELHTVRCDTTDTFTSILAEPLESCGVDVRIEEETRRVQRAGKASLRIPVAEAGVGADHTTTRRRSGARLLAESPRWVAGQLADYRALLVIDEVDAIAKPADRKKLADLIKQLSDRNAKFKILLVGIAAAGAELVSESGHRSVQRCLKETELGRMTTDELRAIVESGAKHLKLTFDADVLRRIVELASGYPHFVHLLALKCAEEAVANKRLLILPHDLEKAQRSAVEDAQASLREAYDAAVRSANTEKYQWVVLAAAKCNGPEFSTAELRERLASRPGVSFSQKNLSSYLSRLVKRGESSLLVRQAKGVYRFRDPRMRSFVRIVSAPLERSVHAR